MPTARGGAAVVGCPRGPMPVTRAEETGEGAAATLPSAYAKFNGTFPKVAKSYQQLGEAGVPPPAPLPGREGLAEGGGGGAAEAALPGQDVEVERGQVHGQRPPAHGPGPGQHGLHIAPARVAAVHAVAFSLAVHEKEPQPLVVRLAAERTAEAGKGPLRVAQGAAEHPAAIRPLQFGDRRRRAAHGARPAPPRREVRQSPQPRGVFDSFVSNVTSIALDSNLTVGGVPATRALLRFALPRNIRDSAQIIRATLLLVPTGPPGGNSSTL